MSRPHPDDYKMPHLEANFNATKLVVLVLSVFLFFILPVITIETIGQKMNSIQTSGEVAGISTTTQVTNTNTLNILGLSINLNSQSGLLAIGGILLFGIAIILVIYLLIDDNTKQKNLKEKVSGSTHTA